VPDTAPPAEEQQPDPDEWVIVLRALPSVVPAAIRVRHLLKRALRDWNLRCVSCSSKLPTEGKH
jgi:hypothetical protein